ncbi:hypothetical protein T310_10318, partial [Rasamsonia emersonii CBS 393.64]
SPSPRSAPWAPRTPTETPSSLLRRPSRTSSTRSATTSPRPERLMRPRSGTEPCCVTSTLRAPTPAASWVKTLRVFPTTCCPFWLRSRPERGRSSLFSAMVSLVFLSGVTQSQANLNV